jgi:hypothetical protein
MVPRDTCMFLLDFGHFAEPRPTLVPFACGDCSDSPAQRLLCFVALLMPTEQTKRNKVRDPRSHLIVLFQLDTQLLPTGLTTMQCKTENAVAVRSESKMYYLPYISVQLHADTFSFCSSCPSDT